MPTGTVSARPDSLLRYLTASVPPAMAVVAQGPVLRGALAQAGAGGLRGRAPLHTGLADRLADHGHGALTIAEATAATGVAFAVAGGPLAQQALFGPLAGADDDTVAAFVAAILGVPLDGGRIETTTLDPDVVAMLVSTLSPQQLARLAATRPRLVGPIDGMPVQLRYAANRVLIAEHADLLEGVGLDEAATRLRGRYLDRQILFFDPAGDGRIAEVFGDLDRAANVAVVIPGMSNSLADFHEDSRSKGQRLFDAAGVGTAVVAWLGYDSPEADEVFLDDAAWDGADELVRLFDGFDDSTLRTVIGHSYGSVVAGAALQRGLDVDQVVVTGSPGMLGDTAREVAGNIPIYAARAELDYVAYTENFGQDPTDPRFGATRIDTGEINLHSDYYEPGSGSLENITRIVTGELDAVGVLAPGPVEQIVTIADEVQGILYDRVDGYQEAAEVVAGGVSWAVDGIEGVLPEPAADVVDGVQDATGRVFEAGNRLIDFGQRLTSIDLRGDMALDLVELSRDHLDDFLEETGDIFDGAGDLLVDAGEDAVDTAGDILEGAGDLVGGLAGGAGDLVGGLIG